MKTCLFYNLPVKNWLAAGMLLLLFTAIPAPAVSQTEKPAKKTTFAVHQPDRYPSRYAFLGSDDTAQHLSREWRLTAPTETTGYPANPALLPPQKKLTAHIYPQPANGNSGDMHLVFNQSLASELHITIQDMVGRTYYSGWHRTENRLLIRFGQTFPVLSPGSYRVTLVSEGMAARKIIMVE